MQGESKKENQQHMDQEDPDMPSDDDMPEFGKKSSLRERSDPDLPVLIEDNYNVQKCKNQLGDTVINGYIVRQELGRGAFGEVVRATKDNKEYAIKVYNVYKLKKHRFFAPDGDFASSLDMLQIELNLIKRLDHQNIPKFYEILHNVQMVYLVHELCTMGQIMKWDQLKENYYRDRKVVEYIQKKYQVTELYDVTRIIFAQVCSAVKYMHDNDITNRDIKVDNILFTETPNKLQEIKLTDFTTIRYNKDDISFFPSGTPGFRGPQHQFQTEQGFSCKACDVWSVGISMYTFFFENFPFYGESQLQVDIKAKNNALVFDESCPSWLKELILKMTQKEWKNRITIDEAFKILIQH